MSMKFKDTIDGSVSKNAATATKLATKRTINGTNFDGSENITTANWGTARNISIADSSATNTGTAVSVNGSGNATLKLPATIKATLTGNADTATTATKANQLTTARNIIIGNKTNSFNGTGNITYTVDDIGASKGQFKTATTAATAQWYRIAETVAGMNRVAGMFFIENTVSGKHSVTTLSVGVNYGINPYVQQLSHSAYSTTGISKARIVYHTSWSGNYAYLEVYQAAATAATMNVRLLEGAGWTLIAPNTVGSIPSGYTNKEITLVNNSIVSNVKGSLSGNASTATKLQTKRTITIGNQGVEFDGSGNISFDLGTIGAATSGHNHDSDYSEAGHTHNYAGSSSAGGVANSAAKLSTARNITIGNKTNSFDGSGNISYTLADIGAAESGHTHSYAGSSSVGGAANSVKTNLTIKLNNGTTEGTNLFTFNGSTAKAINITPSSIGAAGSSHGTHVDYATATPKVAGTAAVGSSSKVAREDHVHPVQTSVSGNAGTATKLATARNITIGNKTNSFDGSANISYTLTDIGAADMTQMGVNKILFERFSRGSETGNGPITEENLIGKTLIDSTFLNDFGTMNVGDSYYGRLTTNLYFSDATEFTTTANSDDGSTIYLNGVVLATLTSCTNTSVTFNFTKGWNTLVWTLNENAGNDTASLNPSIKTASNLVYMNAFPISSSMNAKVIAALRSDSSAAADKLTTPRTLTIGNTGKTFDGSANVSWSLAEIGAAESGHTHNYAGSSSVGGAANSAVKLSTARSINGTSFDGSGNITTANWGTARNISIADSSGTNTGTAVSVNGSANATLKLPATIKASLTGNASTATTLATARTINGTSFNGSGNITTANWGTARTLTIGNKGQSVNGSGNVTWTLADIGASPLQKSVVAKSVSNGVLTLSTDRYQSATLATGNTIVFPSVTGFCEINLFVKDCNLANINIPDNCKWRVDSNLDAGTSYIFTFIYTGAEWLAEVKIYS